MLLTKMDLLNYQYLDKMNNNIGILCYEGKMEGFGVVLLLLRLFLKLGSGRYGVSEVNASDVVDTLRAFTKVNTFHIPTRELKKKRFEYILIC